MVDRSLDDAHHVDAYLVFMRQTLSDLRDALTDDAVVVMVIGDVELDRGRAMLGGVGLAETVWERAAAPEGYRLAGIALDDIAAQRKMTKIWAPRRAGRPRPTDCWSCHRPTRVAAAHSPARRCRSTGPGHRRHACARSRPDWSGRGERPGAPRARAPLLYSAVMQQMYHPDDLGLDGSARPDEEPRPRADDLARLSYILQQQVHLYLPEANELRMEIDRYVEAERQIETELARRSIRA